MALTEARIAEVKQRAAQERLRNDYPEGFPGLPPVPAARYVDPEFGALERDAVFGRSWLFVAHKDQLPQPGDYVLIEHLAKPILLLHGRDGVIRAFYNTCKHRGAALLTEPSGSVGRRLTCPYHSWVYDHEGTLVGYPDSANFRELDPECSNMTRVRCEVWGPLVFLNLDPEAAPLLEWLAPVSEQLSEMAGLDGKLFLLDRTVRDLPVNWKLPVDANIETYHVNTVHRESAGEILDQSATGIWLYRNGHSRMLIGLKEGVPLTGFYPFPEIFQGLGDLPDAGTFSFHLFPNLSIVFVGKGFVFFITNWPSGDGSSSYHVHWCSSLDPKDPANEKANRLFIKLNQTVLFEDLAVLPGMQRSIESGALTEIQLNYQERRIYHVHEMIDRTIGSEQIEESLRVPAVLGSFVEG